MRSTPSREAPGFVRKVLLYPVSTILYTQVVDRHCDCVVESGRLRGQVIAGVNDMSPSDGELLRVFRAKGYILDFA